MLRWWHLPKTRTDQMRSFLHLDSLSHIRHSQPARVPSPRWWERQTPHGPDTLPDAQGFSFIRTGTEEETVMHQPPGKSPKSGEDPRAFCHDPMTLRLVPSCLPASVGMPDHRAAGSPLPQGWVGCTDQEAVLQTIFVQIWAGRPFLCPAALGGLKMCLLSSESRQNLH